MLENRSSSRFETLAVWFLGGAVALFAWLSGNSAVFPPEHWNLVAVAAGLHPPPAPLPGLWLHCASYLFRYAGIEGGVRILQTLGPIALGVLSILVYRIFDEMMPPVLRTRMQKKGWSRTVVATMLMQGVLLFVMSDPVWKAGRFFSPTLLLLMLTMLVLRCLVRGLRESVARPAIVLSALCGLLAVDTPIAFAVPIAFAATVEFRFGKVGDVTAAGFANPLVLFVTFRRMTGAFLLVWLLGFWANTSYFMGQDGLAAQDWDGFGYFLNYLNTYLKTVSGAARPIGWLFICLVCIGPFILSSVLVRQATDDDRFLAYVPGLFFAFAGLLSFVQLAGWYPFWFWRWVKAPEIVSSEYLLCLCVLCSALTALSALCVFGVEIYFRNYMRLSLIKYQDAVEESQAGADTVRTFRTVDRVIRTALVCEPLVVLLLVVPFKFSSIARGMATLVNDVADQTAAECGTARYLFTGGGLDAAVEVAAARQGRPLKVLSMLSGDSPYEQYLRCHGETDEEDRDMLATGAANTLRTWVRNKPERTADIALQIGFELWRHDKLPMPECGGLVARTAGFAEGEAEEWVSRAHALAQRLLDLYSSGSPDDIPNPALKSLFAFVQWRLSRMCRMRADAADARRDSERALAEGKIADELDAKNSAYERVRRQMDWLGFQRSSYITPREGLKFWLDRADFKMSQIYARKVLHADPYDSAANFAMGMSYYLEDQYSRAEIYLKRSLEKHPELPAILNNLAVVQARLGKFAEAETNAVRALEILPDSSEIKSTLNQIRGSPDRLNATRGRLNAP